MTFTTASQMQHADRIVNKHSRNLQNLSIQWNLEFHRNSSTFKCPNLDSVGQIIYIFSPFTVSSAIHLFFLPCFMLSLSLICCDLLATITFLPRISLFQSTQNTVAKVIFLVHHSGCVILCLSLSGGFLSHYTTR